MNHQCVSEIFFEESYTVPADQTAKSLFARLPHGSSYAERLVECLATGYLVAVIESICIREMQQHVDAAEVVVGRTIRIDHRGTIPPGSSLRLRGWLERMGERSATFRVQACDTDEVVCEATVTLVAVQRATIETRIAAKLEALPRFGGALFRRLSREFFRNSLRVGSGKAPGSASPRRRYFPASLRREIAASWASWRSEPSPAHRPR
jgi:fluoroacetyl-CoA thioesterase